MFKLHRPAMSSSAVKNVSPRTNPGFMRIRRIFIWIALLWSQAVSLQPAMAETTNADNNAYDVVMFGTHVLHVPRRWNAGVRSSKGPTNHAAIVMMLTAPDVSPRLTPPPEVGWGDQMTVLIEYPQHDIDPSIILKNELEHLNGDSSSFTLMSNGCHLYVKILLQDMITYNIDNILVISMCYVKDSLSPYPSCKIMENLNDDAHVIYTFSRTYIDQLPNIDRRINELFRSFFVNPE